MMSGPEQVFPRLRYAARTPYPPFPDSQKAGIPPCLSETPESGHDHLAFFTVSSDTTETAMKTRHRAMAGRYDRVKS